MSKNSGCGSCGSLPPISGEVVDEINDNTGYLPGTPVAPTCNNTQGEDCQPVCITPYRGDEPVNYDRCECKRPNCTTCCGSRVHATPSPFSVVPVCTADHQKVVVNNTFSTTLKVNSSWNIPACGASSVVSVPGLTNILIGSYLFHPQFGYYQVLSFDPANHQVTLQNNCNSGNSPVGTQVPACTNFIVAPPPITSDSGGGGVPTIYPYLAIDFTAPANGQCVAITLTTTQGLSVNKNVQIGSGVYQLSAVTNATTATICNQGLGAVPGTPVIARDSANNLQYPVIMLDTNPCTNTPVNQGSILVCNGGLSQPLDGATAGMIPVLVNPESNLVEYQILNIPVRTCTVLTACLTLVPGQASYVLTVADTGQFPVGTRFQLGNASPKWTVTVVNDATHLTATVNPVPGAFSNIPVATSVCWLDCCDQIDWNGVVTNVTIASPNQVCNNIGSEFLIKSAVVNTSGTTKNIVIGGGREHTSQWERAFAGNSLGMNVTNVGTYTHNTLAITELLMSNANPCRQMAFLYNVVVAFDVNVREAGELFLQVYANTGSGEFLLTQRIISTIGAAEFDFRHAFEVSENLTKYIAPSTPALIQIRGQIVTTNAFANTTVWQGYSGSITCIGSTLMN